MAEARSKGSSGGHCDGSGFMAATRHKGVKKTTQAASASSAGWSVPRPSTYWPVLAAGAAIVLTGLTVYANSLSTTFVFDDRPHIFANERIKSIFPLLQTFSGRRPLVDLTLALNYAIGRFDPAGYHAFNVLIHLLSAVTLFAVLRRLLSSKEPSHDSGTAAPIWLPAVITLIWTVHPLQTQAVTYVIQRGESMMGLFYLLTLYCAMRGMGTSGRRWAWYVASVAACACGMATKAVMITAPAVVFLYDWLIETRSFTATVRRRWGLYLALASTSYVLVACGVVAGVLSTTPRHPVNVGFAMNNVTPLAYLMTQPGVILHYLWLSVWPHPLCIDYDWPLATGFAQAAVPAAIVLALIAASVWAAWRHPRIGFAALAFFLVLLPTSSFIPIRDPLFEHRMYLPLAAVIGLVAAGVWAVWRRFAASRALGRRATVASAAALTALVVIALGAGTIRRNGDYQSEVRLWQSATVARPQSTRAHYSLAVALGRAGRHEESLAEFRKVLEVGGERTRADVLAETYYHIGWVLIRNDHTKEAIEAYENALKYDPDHVESTFELGYAHAILGEYDRAAPLFRRTLELRPDHAGAREALAQLKQTSHKP